MNEDGSSQWTWIGVVFLAIVAGVALGAIDLFQRQQPIAIELETCEAVQHLMQLEGERCATHLKQLSADCGHPTSEELDE